MFESTNLICVVVNTPGGEGCEYRVILPDGQTKEIGDAQDEYWEFAAWLDELFPIQDEG